MKENPQPFRRVLPNYPLINRYCWRQLLAGIATNLSTIALLWGRFLATDLQVCRHQQAHRGTLSAGFTVGSTLQNITRTLQNLRNAERNIWWRQYSVRGASGFSKRGSRPPRQGLQHDTSLPEQNKMTSQYGGNTKSLNFVYMCNEKLNTYCFTYVKNTHTHINK
jgi:hypothetical protein